MSGARVSRAIARAIVRGAVGRATSEFILLTIARSRVQRIPIAMNAAIGTALVIAALARGVNDWTSLLHPRTAVLWIPLVIVYWTVIGLRASFFVPSHLPAAWTLSVNGPQPTSAYWSCVRAAMIGVVLPPALIGVLLLVPLVGWRVASWHSLIVVPAAILLIDIVAQAIDFVPFTRP